VFVPYKSFLPRLMFVDKARSSPQSGVLQGGTFISKHDTMWQALSRFKANTFYSIRKTISVRETQQLRPEIGDAI
jgi:hypothetical protein